MAATPVAAFQTSDGALFTDQALADVHQQQINDTLIRDLWVNKAIQLTGANPQIASSGIFNLIFENRLGCQATINALIEAEATGDPVAAIQAL